MMILKRWFDSANIAVKSVIIGVCAGVLAPSVQCWADRVPFDFNIALGYFRLGILALLVYRILFATEAHKRITGFLCLWCFIACSLVWIRISETARDAEIWRLLFPVVFFGILLSLQDILKRSKILIFFGKASLFIYLTNVFVFNAILIVLPSAANGSAMWPKVGIGIGVFALTLMLTCSASLLCSRIKWMDFFFHPTKYMTFFGVVR